MIGPPRRPDRVRVADPALATELRTAHPQQDVVVAPTPELQEVVETMAREMPGGEVRASYLENEIPADDFYPCAKAVCAQGLHHGTWTSELVVLT